MAIIVVLAAVAIPTFGRQMETARETSDMEVIRSAYNEALGYAVLDASDGKLDGKNGAVSFVATTGTITTAADTKTDGTEDNDQSYTVTFASMEPEAKIIQTGADWQFVNASVGGLAVPSVKTTDKTGTGITFKFSLGSSGNVTIAANGITIVGTT